MYLAPCAQAWEKPLMVYAELILLILYTVYCLSYIPYIDYRDTACELLVTPITLLVNFIVMLGEDKETVPANRIYTR